MHELFAGVIAPGGPRDTYDVAQMILRSSDLRLMRSLLR